MTPAEALASAMIDMMGGTQADGDEAAARILAALAAAGWVVVPEAPESTMVAAAVKVLDTPSAGTQPVVMAWTAMLAARPR